MRLGLLPQIGADFVTRDACDARHGGRMFCGHALPAENRRMTPAKGFCELGRAARSPDDGFYVHFQKVGLSYSGRKLKP